jgi:hypothetical protein
VYSSIRRNLFSKLKNYYDNEQSYVNYYFDFDASGGASSRTSSLTQADDYLSLDELESSSNSFNSNEVNSAAASANELKQRRLAMYRDVEFYSLSFDMMLAKNRNYNLTPSTMASSSSLHGATTGEQTAYSNKTNLFTLNTFDDLTTNRIFLFGVNIYQRTVGNTLGDYFSAPANNASGGSTTKSAHSVSTMTDGNEGSIDGEYEYEFEIFTNKQSIRAKYPLENFIDKGSLLHVNVTFTFNSIELRLNGNEEHFLKLTDKYFNLFFRSLLKGYGTFQLNFTSSLHYSYESMSEYMLHSKSGADTATVNEPRSLIETCMSNFSLVTRKPDVVQLNTQALVNYVYARYGLIEQTKSISYVDISELPDVFGSDLKCPWPSKSSSSGRIIGSPASHSQTNHVDEKKRKLELCYLITKVDTFNNKKLYDYYDCKCNNTTNKSDPLNSHKSNCTYYFWSSLNDLNGAVATGSANSDEYVMSDEQELLVELIDSENKLSKSGSNDIRSTCAEAANYACFNNGTCVDVNNTQMNINTDSNDSFYCVCPNFFTGKRYLKTYESLIA